jgi:hypothetical protein
MHFDTNEWTGVHELAWEGAMRMLVSLVSALEGKSLPTWSGTPRHATPKPAAGGPAAGGPEGGPRGITCGAGTLEVRAPRVNEQEARVPVWEEEEYRQFCKRSLEGDNMYVWADGVHFNVRLSDERCVRSCSSGRVRRAEGVDRGRGRRSRMWRA